MNLQNTNEKQRQKQQQKQKRHKGKNKCKNKNKNLDNPSRLIEGPEGCFSNAWLENKSFSAACLART
jgi:16S rRNA U1498 N3-methylase RsmE